MAKNLTEVRLLSVPLESDYLHTLYFSDKETQESYFKGKTKHTMSNCTYQRQDNYIRFDKPIENIINSNYVMYKNSAYSDKWYYAFISKMEYKDDSVTLVYIETDVIQTWYFDYLVKPSFVEREHTDDDTIGKHTVPEQLELGDYICNGSTKCDLFNQYGIVVASTLNFDKLGNKDVESESGTIYNGVFSGCKYYYFPLAVDELTGDSGVKSLENVIKILANRGQSEGIVSMFMVPEALIEIESKQSYTFPLDIEMNPEQVRVVVRRIKSKQTPVHLTWDSTNDGYVNKPTSINGHIPKNNKLFTYPYCYLLMDNNAGSSAVYKYELFDNGSEYCTFDIACAVTPGCSIRLTPFHYNNLTINTSEGLNAGKLPICSWSTDVYTNWLTQNSINIGLSVGSSLLTALGGVALMGTGAGALAGAGSVVSGVMGVASTIGEIYQHSLQPPQAEGNINNGDVIFADGYLGFVANKMTIKREYAQIIDGYFTMFGYKVNQVHTPLKNHRESFWYTKTIDVNIDGAIPQDDMKKIKECYNKGITFWRHTVDIGNYSQDNGII